jgi:hypothetical protein
VTSHDYVTGGGATPAKLALFVPVVAVYYSSDTKSATEILPSTHISELSFSERNCSEKCFKQNVEDQFF